MTKLEALTRELCPNGVAYLKLEDIAQYCKTRINASIVNKDNYKSHKGTFLTEGASVLPPFIIRYAQGWRAVCASSARVHPAFAASLPFRCRTSAPVRSSVWQSD